ncbi:MAG: hypothetical protein AAGD14_19820, partial [Planctomycetota bacterium]
GEQVHEKGDDLDVEVDAEDGDGAESGTLAFIGLNGQVTMEIGGSKLRGFFSDDGSIAVLRMTTSDLAEGGEAGVGMIILIRE